MPIRDILLHVDASPAYGRRLRVTLLLARLFEARVIGMGISPDPDVLALAQNGFAAAALATELARLEDETAQLGSNLMAALGRQGVLGEWRTAKGSAAAVLARHAHVADLIVLSQNDPDHPTDLANPGDVVFTSGRPVLIVPYSGRFERIGKQIMIAWNSSREATRAVHAALPLMTASDVVTVFSAKPIAERDNGDHGAELVRHLQRHNLRVARETGAAAQEDVADTLQVRAANLGADVIVMGAFGHSRLRETILGGTTSDMLEQMTTPVLMTH